MKVFQTIYIYYNGMINGEFLPEDRVIPKKYYAPFKFLPVALCCSKQKIKFSTNFEMIQGYSAFQNSFVC